ncbi:hypothetical protein EV175_004096, partial [Coemansia sp. RSA 1933]
FKFFATPYYLRLTFPGNVVEDDKSTASFDAASGCVLVTLSKETQGEQFRNLDLLTGLLATRREREKETVGAKHHPVIEEIDRPLGPEEREVIRMDEDFDWEMPQAVCLDDSEREGLLIKGAEYGFNQQYSGMFAHVHEIVNEINELADPESMTAEERTMSRIAAENAKFDEDYYMENYLYDDDTVPLIRFKIPFYHILKQKQRSRKTQPADKYNDGGDPSSSVNKLAHDIQQNLSTDEPGDEGWEQFTEDERKTMLDLPRKTYTISKRQPVYLGLVDILFAYSLDYRTNLGEHTVESAWAIGAVSSLFSNLAQFTTLRDTAVSCFRRGLAYPLCRNWELCEKALEDVYVILKLGRRAVLKTMLEIKSLFDHHDVYYVYSKIFLDDYCVWLQTNASEKALQSLAHQVRVIELEKEETGWPLNEYEDLALHSSDSDDGSEDGIGADDIYALDPGNEDEGADHLDHQVAEPVVFPSSVTKNAKNSKPMIQEIGSGET